MITPIILSATDANAALTTFKEWLEEPVTLIVVIGNNEQADQVVSKISTLINSGDVFYNGTRVLQVPKVSFIKTSLQTLAINPRLEAITWDTTENQILLSITNVHHNIGDYLQLNKFPNRPVYYTERLIMKALGFDKPLT